MNILSLNISDLGGLSYNLCQAINKHTNHLARSVIEARTFTRKPFMIQLVNSQDFFDLFQSWVREADVLHFNEEWLIMSRYKINPKICKDKKVVFHAHGSHFRRKGKRVLANYRKAFPQLKVITSTPDLLEHVGSSLVATWFPSIVPIAEYRQQYKRTQNIPPVVYYSPTGSSSKSMRNIIHDVSKELWNDGIKFKLQVTTDTLHVKNMRMKAMADIYYDEIYPSPFYGVNAIEAGALEKPVICNMSSYARQYMEKLSRQTEVDCPFLVVENRNELKRTLRKLVLDDKLRAELGNAGLKYVCKTHDEKTCVGRFLELVES